MATAALARTTAARRAVARQIRRRRVVTLVLLLALPLLWMVGLYLAPLVFLLMNSFWKLQNYQIAHQWSFFNYHRIFSDPLWLQVLLRTAVMACLVTLSTVVLALPLAYFLVRYTARFRNLLYLAVLVPLWSSYLVRVFAWKTILGSNGLLNSFLISLHIVHQPVQFFLYSNTAVYITFVYIWLPYMILPVYAAIERIPPSLLEASADLGARGRQTMARVVWPLAFPGVLAGGIIVFSLTMGDFITPLLMGNCDQYIGSVIVE